jgi:phospholipid-binding lipoprotein MlaA
MNAISTIIIITAVALTGCASSRAGNPADPFEPINRGIYKFNDTVDKAVIKPVARGYKAVIPAVGRIMVSNFFSNLDDVDVTANDLLQFKLVQGFSDGTRFVVNSTLGVFGLIDVASTGGLKKHDEDFGQTMGKWGIGNGPYLVLPILGPSTLRDTIGLYGDGYASPIYQMKNMQARNQAYLLRGINRRAEFLDQEKVLNEAMIDPYQFMRDAYLLRRKSLIYDGNPPRPKYNYDDDLSNDDSLPPPVASAPLPAKENPPPVAPR